MEQDSRSLCPECGQSSPPNDRTAKAQSSRGNRLAPPALMAGSASKRLGQPRARHALTVVLPSAALSGTQPPSIKLPPVWSLQEPRVAASTLCLNPLPSTWALGRALGASGPGWPA